VQNISGALCQAGSAAVTGICIVAFGYRDLLIANAVTAVLASFLFLLLGMNRQKAPIADETRISSCKPDDVADCMEV